MGTPFLYPGDSRRGRWDTLGSFSFGDPYRETPKENTGCFTSW